MAKKTLARKIMLSILTGAVLFGNSVAWAVEVTDDFVKVNGSTASTATGNNSIAVGNGASATGKNSIAVGNGADASGWNSDKELTGNAIAIGNGANATGEFSTAIGNTAIASGFHAFAFGYNAKASGSDSIALGWSTDVSGNNSIAIGLNAKATSFNSLALGSGSEVTVSNAVAIGHGSIATESGTFSVGDVDNKRKIVNVANGTSDTDAVNLGQLRGKADKATTLAGYGITDAYTKAQANSTFATIDALANVGGGVSSAVTDATMDDTTGIVTLTTQKINENGDEVPGTSIELDLNEYYASKTALDSKANSTDVYTKTEADGLLDNKADKTTTLAGYGITDAYTKSEVYTRADTDTAIATKTGALNYSSANYIDANDNLTVAAGKLDAQIKVNADNITANTTAIKNEATARENADINSAELDENGNLILTTKGGTTITATGHFATKDDVTTITGAAITDISYDSTNEKLTYTKDHATTVIDGIASSTSVSDIASKIGLSNNGVLDYGSDTILGSKTTLKDADIALSNAIATETSNRTSTITRIDNTITTINSSIDTINTNIGSTNFGDFSGLQNTFNSNSLTVAQIVEKVYAEAKAYNTVSGGAGITVTPEANGNGATDAGSNVSGTTNSNGGTNYVVSENVTYVGDNNLTVTESTDSSKVSVSLNKDIQVDSVTATTVNSSTVNTDIANVKNQINVGEGDTKTIITNDTVNTTNVSATNGNFTNNVVIGTGDSTTVIQGDTVTTKNVTTNNFTSTNANITNVTTNNFVVKDGETVITEINKEGMTVNNTFTTIDQEGNKTIIEGDKISVTNKEGNTTIVEGNKITTNEIKLGDTTTNQYVTINQEGMTITNNNNTVIINENGIGFGGADSGSGEATGPVIDADGLDMNDKKVTNVGDGEIAEGSKDAVNGGQIYELQQQIVGSNSELVSRVNKLGTRLNKVGAGAAALAALHPLDFDPEDKLSFSAGVGNYAGQNAAALGMFYRPNEKVMLSMGGTMGNGEEMVNMGISFALDKPNNVSNSRVAMAKEINALREHVAQQDAQLAKQDEQIAQLVMLVNQLTGNKAEYKAGPVVSFPKESRVRVERLSDGYEEYDRVKVVNHKEYGDKAAKAEQKQASK